MKLLVIGHSLVIDSNRAFWSVFSMKTHAVVDAIVPERWSSNLKSDISWSFNPVTDSSLRHVIPLKTYLRGNGSFYFHSPWGLFKTLNGEHYDVVYVNQETWALSTFAIILLKLFSRSRDAKLYLCVAQNIKKSRLKFLHPYERIISRFVHAFLFCSEEVKTVLRWKGINNPCIYFPLPYDERNYKITLPPANPETLLLGYLGRVSDDKGMTILLKACDELRKEGFPFRLILGGSGPMVPEVKSRDYVDFLGLIPHNIAHTFYQQIHCFILPSQTRANWKEQFGRVIVESFGAGKPVIGSSSGSIPEVLGKLNWPWIFKEDSSEELVELIHKLSEELKTVDGRGRLQRAAHLNSILFSQEQVAISLHRSFSE